jgi:hypothetical protein
MDPKPKVSPNVTYIFDEEDLDLLDSFSLSAILDDTALDDDTDTAEIGDFADTVNSLDDAPAARRSEDMQAEAEHEPTIDELMAGTRFGQAADGDSDVDPDTADTGTFAALEVLLPPELMFPAHNGDDED